MKFITILFIILLIGIALFESAPQGIRPDVEDLVRQSKFIFKGTVVKLNAATMPIIQDTRNKAIVKVDEVLEVPKTFGNFTAKEITVLLKEPEKAEVGQQAIFFTNGWLYGKSIAVTEVGNLRFGEEPSKLRQQVIRAVQMLPDRNLQLRLARAELVIVGKVIESREATELNQRQPISEHSPEWWEAVIEIKSLEKGRYAQKNITVLFPNSPDVLWYQSPKFRVDQEGIWLLHINQILELKIEGYTALDPMDFYPKEQLGRIRKLLKAIK
ncbi:MAG: hypothetical protein ACE5JB_13010 [bacterium]